MPPGNDNGFLWRLNSYWRFLEKDNGVYVQCEAISLTRDVPTGLNWLIGPFIESIPKRISRIHAAIHAQLLSCAEACMVRNRTAPDIAKRRPLMANKKCCNGCYAAFPAQAISTRLDVQIDSVYGRDSSSGKLHGSRGAASAHCGSRRACRSWVNSDHLTLLGFVAMFLAGASYALVRWNRAGIITGHTFSGAQLVW